MSKIEEVVAAFDRFALSTGHPSWSSWLLKQWFAGFVVNNHGTMTEVLQGFDLALFEHEVRLTDTVANLIKDVVVLGFTGYRESYDRVDWRWATDALTHSVNSARAYLFLLAIPSAQLSPESIVGILRGLEGTLQFEQALNSLAEELRRTDVRRELQQWRLSGMEKHIAIKIDVLLSNQIDRNN